MEANDVQRFRAAFRKIKSRFDERNNDGLICKKMRQRPPTEG
jgi:hypothetical protein